MLKRIVLGAALVLLATFVARRTRPSNEVSLNVRYGDGTLTHRGPGLSEEVGAPISLTFDGPKDTADFLYVTLIWRMSGEEPWNETPLRVSPSKSGRVFTAPSLPFDEGTAVQYRIIVVGPKGRVELPSTSTHFLRRHVGDSDRSRRALHAALLLIGLFAATVAAVDAVGVLRGEALEKRLFLAAALAAVVLGVGAVLTIGLALDRGLPTQVLTRLFATSALFMAAAALALLGTARPVYRRPAAVSTLVAAALTLVGSLLPHSF